MQLISFNEVTIPCFGDGDASQYYDGDENSYYTRESNVLNFAPFTPWWVVPLTNGGPAFDGLQGLPFCDAINYLSENHTPLNLRDYYSRSSNSPSTTCLCGMYP
ncbi:MAG: hypothetical protein V1848_02310 [Candidatus Magasanikbacteria bacterium]